MTQNRHVVLEFTFGRLECQNFTVTFSFSQQFLDAADVPAVGRRVDDIKYSTSPKQGWEGKRSGEAEKDLQDLAPQALGLATPRATTPRAATPRATPRKSAPLSAAAAGSLQRSGGTASSKTSASVSGRLDELLAVTSSTLQKRKPWVDQSITSQEDAFLR